MFLFSFPWKWMLGLDRGMNCLSDGVWWERFMGLLIFWNLVIWTLPFDCIRKNTTFHRWITFEKRKSTGPADPQRDAGGELNNSSHRGRSGNKMFPHESLKCPLQSQSESSSNLLRIISELLGGRDHRVSLIKPSHGYLVSEAVGLAGLKRTTHSNKLPNKITSSFLQLTIIHTWS